MNIRKKIISALLTAAIIIVPTVNVTAYNKGYNDDVTSTVNIFAKSYNENFIYTDNNEVLEIQEVNSNNYFNKCDNTSVVVEKNFFDEADKKEKRKIKEILETELDNNKPIIFLGSEENLNLDDVAEALGEEIDYKIGDECLQGVTGIAVAKDESGEPLVMVYLDFSNEDSEDENLENIISSVDEDFDVLNNKNSFDDAEVVSAEITPQKTVYYGSDEEFTSGRRYGVATTYRTIKSTLYFYWIRTANKSTHTEWEIRVLVDSSPYSDCHRLSMTVGTKAHNDDAKLVSMLPSKNGSQQQFKNGNQSWAYYLDGSNAKLLGHDINPNDLSAVAVKYSDKAKSENQVHNIGAKYENYSGDLKIKFQVAYITRVPNLLQDYDYAEYTNWFYIEQADIKNSK